MFTYNGMEWISSFAGKEGLPALITIVVIAALVLLFIKKGYIAFNGHGLKVGQDQQTRNLIQAQFEYANAKIEGTISTLPSHLDQYHTKYVFARVEDVVQKAIIFNNMTTDEPYIKAKQELVYQTVMKRITDDFFKTEEFKEFCYKFVKELFTELVKMKRIYNG